MRRRQRCLFLILIGAGTVSLDALLAFRRKG